MNAEEKNERTAAVLSLLNGLSYADANWVLKSALMSLETKSFVMSEPPKDNVVELTDKVVQRLAKTIFDTADAIGRHSNVPEAATDF